MTIPNLPHVELGNAATDISSAGSNLVQGLVQQRLRQQQIAMQKALQDAQIAHLGAETNEANVNAGLAPGKAQSEEAYQGAQTDFTHQNTQKFGHENESIGDDQVRLLQRLSPKSTPQEYSGMTRGEADTYIAHLMAAQAAQQRINISSAGLGLRAANPILTRFNQQAKPHKDALNYYQNINSLLDSNSAIAPIDILGSMSQLAVPGNARAVGTMLTMMKSGTPLGGPFTAYENIFNTLGKIFATQGNYLDENAKNEIRKAARALIANHIKMYDQILQTHLHQAGSMGADLTQQDFDSEDPFADVRTDLANPNPMGTPQQRLMQAPQGGTGYNVNPRFLPTGP